MNVDEYEAALRTRMHRNDVIGMFGYASLLVFIVVAGLAIRLSVWVWFVRAVTL